MVANKSPEIVAVFKYLGKTNQNCIQEEFKNILNSGKAYCHSV
jgi:hypothetical protein